MQRRQWFLMDAENGGEGGNGTGGTGGVDAATARTFVSEFVHDPKVLEGMPDDQVVAYHGKLTGALDKVRPAGGKWPDKWKDELASGDEKARARLERFATPGDIFKSFRALEQRMSSGELKANVPFPEKGTDVEKATWRKDQGLPESPDKYELKLPAGFVIGEADKPLVDDFLKSAHAGNLPPVAVNQAVNWFFQNRDKQLAAGKEQRAAAEKETEDALRGEWGNDYRKNEGLIDGLLAETLADEALRQDISAAGKLNPGLKKWMLGVALQLNPTGTILPSHGGDQVKAVADELADLKRQMGDMNSDYRSKDKGPALQARYRELLEAQQRLTKKAA